MLLLQNVSTIDRVVRVAIGFALMVAAYFTQDNPDTMFAFTIVSFYPLLTALTEWDPIYAAVVSVLDKETATQKSDVRR